MWPLRITHCKTVHQEVICDAMGSKSAERVYSKQLKPWMSLGTREALVLGWKNGEYEKVSMQEGRVRRMVSCVH